MIVIKKRKLLRIIVILVIAGIVIGGGSAYYLINMPHRNIQTSKTDFSLTSTQIVNEYLSNAQSANEKYLAKDGESKILEITGIISKISEDYSGNKVVLLKSKEDKAGVNCTFTVESNAKISRLQNGKTITVKGVIRSGASYDEDLELYENVILEKCDIAQE